MSTGHVTAEVWLGERVETLADLRPKEMWALCVGINPSKVSVAVGHYYQGRLGKRHWARLRQAGVLADAAGWEDELAVQSGIGFTDVVKKPTASASELAAADWHHGRDRLAAALADWRPRLVIFTYKEAANAWLSVPTPGLHSATPLEGTEAFVMPGPYAPRDQVDALLEQLGAAANRLRR